MLRWLAAFLCLVLSAAGWAAEFVAIPALSARVTDLTGTLTPERIAALDAASAAIEREKGAQVAILLLPTTQPETIEQFGIRLADAWKIGRRGTSDGVIVIVAKDDRKMRIEVGYGLEGAIPDALAKRIVAEEMAPRFREGDFAGGLDAAVATLARLIGGESLPAPAPPSGSGGDDGSGVFWIFGAVLSAGFLHATLGIVGSLVAAGLAGGLAWWVFGNLGIAAIAALVAFVFSFMHGSGRGLGGGGFSSGGGGFPGGGGGFSGGGGGFGGGGASGSW